MAIEIVTESSTTYEKEELEKNAVALLTKVLEEYDPEPWEATLLSNIIQTIGQGDF